jgi:hypothetical protein
MGRSETRHGTVGSLRFASPSMRFIKSDNVVPAVPRQRNRRPEDRRADPISDVQGLDKQVTARPPNVVATSSRTQKGNVTWGSLRITM